MKRDLQLRDWILSVLEAANDPFLGANEIVERVLQRTDNEYSDEQIIHHIHLASDAGLVKEKNGDIRLTNAGYELLEKMRETL